MTLLEQYEAIRNTLSPEERLERLELVGLTLTQQQAELLSRLDAILSRAEQALERIEREGPAALLGGVLGRRRRG